MVNAETLAENFDPYRNFVEDIPRLLAEARSAANTEALSYRKFHVGATGKLLNHNDFTAVYELSAGNMKVSQQEPKFCAEMNIIEQANQIAGENHFVGVVIAGTTDRDEIEAVNGIATPTLHPCDRCRHEMVSSAEFGADTMIITAGLKGQIAQVHFFGEMLGLYEGNAPADALTYATDTQFGFEEWPNIVDYYDEVLAAEHLEVSKPLIAKLAIESAIID